LRGERPVILTWVRKCDSLQFGHASSVRGERPARGVSAGERFWAGEGILQGKSIFIFCVNDTTVCKSVL